MALSEDYRPILAAAVETLLPAENHPPGLHDAVLAEIDRRLAAESAPFEPLLAAFLDWLHGETFTVFSADFVNLHPGTRDEMFDRVEAQNFRTEWDADKHGGLQPDAVFSRFVDLVADSYEAVKPEDEGGGASRK